MLAEHYGVTMKAVRDIWNLRTWTAATMPYWTSADHRRYLRKHLCKTCQRSGVKSFAEACNACSKQRCRGRPALVRPVALGSADAKNQEDSVVDALPCAKDWAVKEAGQADDLRPRGVTALRKALPGWVDLQDNDDCLHLAAHGMYDYINRDPWIQESCHPLPTFRQFPAIEATKYFQKGGECEAGVEESECDLSFLSSSLMREDDSRFFQRMLQQKFRSQQSSNKPVCKPLVMAT